MGHKYFCTNCGKELDQENILFDMQKLLNENSNKKFSYLPFRMTAEELETLVQSGEAADENGYHLIEIPFEFVAKIMSNSRNLNDPNIENLTVEDLRAYIAAEEKKTEEKPRVENISMTRLRQQWGDNQTVSEEKTEEEAQKTYERPKVIESLLSALESSKPDNLVAEEIIEEMQMLISAFFETDKRKIPVKLRKEPDDQGNAVLKGCMLIHPITGRQDDAFERICSNPKCRKPLPEQAFFAEHHAVVFIGNPASGKTSTILALTHYATEYMQNRMSPIWRTCETVEEIRELKLIQETDNLKKDLQNYAMGLAPYRTPKDAREKAYSASFWIVNQSGKKSILTLIDLPGELFENLKAGNENAQDLQNEYKVALSCHAYIVCFDAEVAEQASKRAERTQTKKIEHVLGTNAIKEKSMGEIIAESTSHAFEIQRLRRQQGREDQSYVPMMVLYTKCKELEQEQVSAEQEQASAEQNVEFDAFERIYHFCREKRAIENDGIYNAVSRNFSGNEELAKAYHAMLRCSPFGYGAPSVFDVELLAYANKNRGTLGENQGEEVLADGRIQEYDPENLNGMGESADEQEYDYVEKQRELQAALGKLDSEKLNKLQQKVDSLDSPTPHNIDKLMIWIMNISGCIATEAEYVPGLRERGNRYPLQNYFVQRIQYRTEKAEMGGKFEEALARCALFENPTNEDRSLVREVDEVDPRIGGRFAELINRLINPRGK